MNTCKNCNKKFKYGEHVPDREKATKLCLDCLNKPFEITSVCRLDLLDKFTPEQVGSLDDGDLDRIASKLADAYCDNGFWIDLEIIGEYVLEDK